MVGKAKTDLRTKVKAIIAEQTSQIIGHDEAIEGAWLAVFARVPAMFIGPPGIGKSQICDGVLDRMPDMRAFKTTFNEFMTVDEVLGPVSFGNLKRDLFKREVTGYLPWAEIAFVDEWSRCTGPLASCMLNLLNEGHYFDGNSRQQSDLQCTLLAANYLPDEEEAFGAVLDRLVLRFNIGRIDADETNLRTAILMGGGKKDINLSLTRAEVEQIWAEVMAVEVPAEFAQIFVAEEMVPAIAKSDDTMFNRCSDRRIHKGMRVAQAKAWLEGSEKVERAHGIVYRNILWNEPHEIEKADLLVSSLVGLDALSMEGNTLPAEVATVVETHKQVMEIASQMVGDEAVAAIEECTGDALSKLEDIRADWEDKLRNVQEKEQKLAKLADGRKLINDQMSATMLRMTEAV